MDVMEVAAAGAVVFIAIMVMACATSAFVGWLLYVVVGRAIQPAGQHRQDGTRPNLVDMREAFAKPWPRWRPVPDKIYLGTVVRNVQFYGVVPVMPEDMTVTLELEPSDPMTELPCVLDPQFCGNLDTAPE